MLTAGRCMRAVWARGSLGSSHTRHLHQLAWPRPVRSGLLYITDVDAGHQGLRNVSKALQLPLPLCWFLVGPACPQFPLPGL